MTVLVWRGGISSERKISLKSATSVVSALHALGHSVHEFDPADGLSGLSEYVGQVDVVFPVLHGQQGEDGIIQAALEDLALSYVGSDSRVSALCFDKRSFIQSIADMGMATPTGILVNQTAFEASPLRQQPFVLKPNTGGSSIDTFICRDPRNLPPQIDKAFTIHHHMLLEQLIKGTEITVPVLGDQALPVIEIIPPQEQEFDFTHKYNGLTQELCPPVSVSSLLQAEAQQLALQIHLGRGVRHFSRTDMMIDTDGKIWVLELNTIPGLTATGLFPKAAQQAGISMTQLVDQLLTMALDGSIS